jgi:oligopeptide transport system permease protein
MSEKNPISFQLTVDDFLPASDAEKQNLVQMRPSVGFWKDAMRRLLKNKVAMVSLVVILVIMVFSFLITRNISL